MSNAPAGPPARRSPSSPPPSIAKSIASLFSLEGRVAIVTGGSRGLGKEMAASLGEAGARLAISARREQWLRPAAEELAAAGCDCLAVPCDVTDPAQCQALVERTLERFGRIDVLVNNAGISWGAPSVDLPLERWRSVLDVNATGAFIMSQLAARHMIERGESERQGPQPGGLQLTGVTGKIINVSSIMGLRGLPPDVLSAASYSASKGALNALTRALAVEWAPHNITVNALAPGFFPTRLSEGVIEHHQDALLERIPLRRFGSEADIRAAIVYLAAPASDYVTGQVLSLDGGATAL